MSDVVTHEDTMPIELVNDPTVERELPREFNASRDFCADCEEPIEHCDCHSLYCELQQPISLGVALAIAGAMVACLVLGYIMRGWS